jgi:hypothetical protein
LLREEKLLLKKDIRSLPEIVDFVDHILNIKSLIAKQIYPEDYIALIKDLKAWLHYYYKGIPLIF